MYPKICLMLQHLSPLFKASLKNWIDQIMIPIRDVKKPMKNEMKITILKWLPNAISGICKSTNHLDKDEFIKNCLRIVFKEVMEKFNVQDLTEFFCLILNHEEDRLSDLIFRASTYLLFLHDTCHFSLTLSAQSFTTSLMADFHQDINGGFVFSRCLNGTFS